jgi:hypothetical protein
MKADGVSAQSGAQHGRATGMMRTVSLTAA